MQSVGIGVPSKSACSECSPRRCTENPSAPASIASFSSRCISFCSAFVAGRDFAASRPMT